MNSERHNVYSEDKTSKPYFVSLTFEDKWTTIRTSPKSWAFNFNPDIQIRLEWTCTSRHYYNFGIRILKIENFKSFKLSCELSIFRNDGDQREVFNVKTCVTFSFPGEYKPITNWNKDIHPLIREFATIRCTLSVEPDSENHVKASSKRITAVSQETFLETLSNDFVKYLEEQVATDCVVNAGGERIPAHRTVLSARSKVFAAIFRHDNLESISGEVDIQNIEETMVKDIIYYMYSGKIRGLTSDTAVRMYEAADMYDLLELKRACLDFLLQNLTVENICNVASLAETYGETALEAEVLKFVRPKLEEIEKTATWKDFFAKQPLLVNKILLGILRKR